MYIYTVPLGHDQEKELRTVHKVEASDRAGRVTGINRCLSAAMVSIHGRACHGHTPRLWLRSRDRIGRLTISHAGGTAEMSRGVDSVERAVELTH